MSTRRRRWTPQTIEAELAVIVAHTGAFPTRKQLEQRGLSGLYKAMGRHGGVAHFKSLLAADRCEVTERPQPTHEQIAARAYFLHLDGHPGDDTDRWLAAEQQLTCA